LNDQQIFLGDWKLSELQEKLGVPVVPLKNDFNGIFEFLQTGKITSFEAPKEFEFEFDLDGDQNANEKFFQPRIVANEKLA
jgi:hypothetical protein